MMDTHQLRLVSRLERALSLTDTHTVADIIQLARDCQAQIWEGDDALIVTALNDYPLRRVLRYWAAAGSMDAVRALQPRIETWAREHGANRADAIGRLGWERVDPERWTRVAGYWRKEL